MRISKLLLLVLALGFCSASATAQTETWQTRLLLNSDSVKITLKYKPIMRVQDSCWLVLEMENKTSRIIDMGGVSLFLRHRDDTIYREGLYLLQQGTDFRDVDLISEWKDPEDHRYRDTIHPYNIKPSWRRINDDMTARFVSYNYDRKNNKIDPSGYDIKITPILKYLISGRKDIVADPITIHRAEITKEGYVHMAAKLEEYLSKERTYLEYSELIQALLQKPIVDIMGEEKIIASFLDPEYSSAFKNQRIAQYLHLHCTDCTAIDSFVFFSIKNNFTVHAKEILGYWWDKKFVLPLAELLESKSQEQFEAKLHLIRHASDWNDQADISARIARCLIEMRPIINTPPDSLNHTNAYYWSSAIKDLITTKDTIALPYLRPHINNKTVVYRYRAYDFSNFPRYLPPSRVCDFVLDGIYAIKGRDILIDFLKVSGKTVKETFWNHDSFNDPQSFLNPEYMEALRDKLLEKLIAAGEQWPPIQD